jgi:hypothetical protein
MDKQVWNAVLTQTVPTRIVSTNDSVTECSVTRQLE